jgi:hypothetical protein
MRTLKTVRRLVLGGTFLLTICVSTGFAQVTVLGENCDLSVIGAKETKTFLAFDREFRSALSNQDAGMMALLVKYPFRINDDRGSYYLQDARSLQSRFKEIFSPAVRDVVLKQRPGAVWCSYSGIMYGDGGVWVGFTNEYKVETINLPEDHHSLQTLADKVKFACDPDDRRVIVDVVGTGKPRYRVWNKPRSLTEKPDMQILEGKEDSEGSGPCRYTSWTFTSATTNLVIRELGECYEDSHQPPSDAKGALDVSAAGQPDASSWCH